MRAGKQGCDAHTSQIPSGNLNFSRPKSGVIHAVLSLNRSARTATCQWREFSAFFLAHPAREIIKSQTRRRTAKMCGHQVKIPLLVEVSAEAEAPCLVAATWFSALSTAEWIGTLIAQAMP
jgi:hypothetical protein